MGFSIPINISSEIEIIKETKKGFNVIGTLTNDNIPKNKPETIKKEEEEVKVVMTAGRDI